MRNSNAIWIPTSSAENNQSTGYIPAPPSLLGPSGDSLPAPSCLSLTSRDSWDITNPGYTSSSLAAFGQHLPAQLCSRHPSAASRQRAFRNSSTPPAGLSQFPLPSPSLRSRISTTATNIQCGFLIHGNRWGRSGAACHSLSHTWNTQCGTVTPLTRLPGRQHSHLIPKDSRI